MVESSGAEAPVGLKPRLRAKARSTIGMRLYYVSMLKTTSGFVLLLAVAGPGLAANLNQNSPTGSAGLLLIDKMGRQVRFLDPSTFKEISSVEVGVAPHDFVISPDHKTAYIPVYGDGIYGRNTNPGRTIAVVDLVNRKVDQIIDISPYQAPHGIQIDATGSTIYVTCDLSRKVLVIDTKTRKIKTTIDTEGTGHWIAVLPDASKLYVANKNDRLFVSVLDLKTNKMVGKIPAPNGTQGIVASPDGKHVIVGDNSEPKLLVIDTKSDTVTDTITLENSTRGVYKPYYTPDGSKLIVCSENPPLVHIIDANNPHGKQTVLTVGKDPMGFAVSSDGKTLLVANHGDGTVSVVDLSAGKISSTFKAGTGIETLSYY
jgi:DNA-binding beta-propeller fold protein YncE